MNRPGFALVFVVAIIGAVELLTLSVLALAGHEAVISDMRLRTTVAGRAADAAIARLSATWPHRPLDNMTVGTRLALQSSSNTVTTVERVSWGLYHVAAQAKYGRARVGRAAVLRTLDVHRALRESNEAVATAGFLIAPTAEISIDAFEVCSSPLPSERPPALVTVTSAKHAAGLPEARIDSLHAVLPEGYALAGVRWEELESIADFVLSGALALADTDSLGAPVFPLRYVPGDLEITGGTGSGLLFVAGNLKIAAGTSFNGIIVVQGRVEIADAVDIHGVLRVHDTSVSVIGAARLQYSRCAVLRALLETPARSRLIQSARVYIPLF